MYIVNGNLSSTANQSYNGIFKSILCCVMVLFFPPAPISVFPLLRRVTDLKDALWSGSLTFQHALSTFAADENTSGRKFASYTVFKGKAALSMQPILPSFSKLEVCTFLFVCVLTYNSKFALSNFPISSVWRISCEQKWIGDVDFFPGCGTKEI
jgi:hypothetical protein